MKKSSIPKPKTKKVKKKKTADLTECANNTPNADNANNSKKAKSRKSGKSAKSKKSDKSGKDDKSNKSSKNADGFTSLKETPTIDRPREKMIEKGAKALSNRELMMALLGIGVRGRDVAHIADDIVKLSETDFENLSLESLTQIQGIKDARACQIMAAIEFSRRFLIREGISVKTDRDVWNLVTELSGKKQEHFLTLTIDGNQKLIRKRTVFIGTLNQSLVHPREIFADAISDRAAGIVLVHNHPSGNCSPSSADYDATDRMLQAGKIMGIEIIDHIIVGNHDFFSFQKSGYFRKNQW